MAGHTFFVVAVAINLASITQTFMSTYDTFKNSQLKPAKDTEIIQDMRYKKERASSFHDQTLFYYKLHLRPLDINSESSSRDAPLGISHTAKRSVGRQTAVILIDAAQSASEYLGYLRMEKKAEVFEIGSSLYGIFGDRSENAQF
ncbi:hypothetical protein C8J57DRAFT_1211482 [Mycena rebaudengoi]|nr:hypothetical protein C8J57DRAFT_1211482 [Mycena rebaudengoi]